MSSCSLSQTSFLQRTLENLFTGKTLKLQIDNAEPVAVIALQRYLSDHRYFVGPQQAVDSYRYDLTVTDGVCRAKCALSPRLNHLVHNNLLRSGVEIHLRQCTFVYNERRLGQGCVYIESIDRGGSGGESDILRNAKDLESLPVLSKDSIGHGTAWRTEAPLQAGRKHYLSLWNNEDPDGEVWVPDTRPADVVLDVSRITFLCDLGSSVGSTFRLPPLIVRIMHKSRLRYWGKIGQKSDYPYQAYIEVADQSGTMSVVLWSEQCSEWYQRMNVGTVLYLQNYALKRSYPRRSRPRMDVRMKTFHALEISLNTKNPTASITIVPPKKVPSQWGLPEVSYHFTTRSELENLSNNESCDVVGLVTFVGRAERVKSKEGTDPEKYWTYRWVHVVDGTSNLPFILEIFASSQPEIFNDICPMTILVCIQMRMCQVEGSLPYLTSSCETQVFTTGFHKGQPYASHPRLKSFIQWIKTLTESVMLRKTVVGGHYCFPHAPQVFTQSVANGSAQVPLVAATDLKRELESMHYREHKRLAIQGKIVAVQYFRWPEEELSDQEQQTEVSAGVTVMAAPDTLKDLRTTMAGPDPLRDQRAADTTEASGEELSSGRPKRKRPTVREMKRRHVMLARMQEKGTAGLIDSEPEEEEHDPLEGNSDQIGSVQNQVCPDIPESDSAPGERIPDRDGSSWESSSWPVQRREVSEHLHSGGVFPESHSQRYTFDDRKRLLQQSNLHPARWVPGDTTDTNSPVVCRGYYKLTILGINQTLALDAAFVPVLTSEDPRSVGLPQVPHDNTLLSCLSAGFLCPLSDSLGPGEALPEPEEILGTAEELKDTHFVCILDFCHLGGEKVEVVMNKMYRMTDVVLK